MRIESRHGVVLGSELLVAESGPEKVARKLSQLGRKLGCGFRYSTPALYVPPRVTALSEFSF
jgi:hypothetical protein